MDFYSLYTDSVFFFPAAINLPLIGTVDLAPYIATFFVFIVLSGLFWLLRQIVLARLAKLSSRTSTDIDDVIITAVSGIKAWVYTLVSLYIALQLLNLPSIVDTALTGVTFFAIVHQAIEIILSFITYGTKRFLETDEDGDGEIDPNAATTSDMVKLLARIVLWSLGGLFVLSNLGIEVTSLIAGLGIGGIAVAFALQGILSDLFSSFSIYFDKPFRVGDFIVVGNDMGTVERIGVKTTRIRTLQGEELVISNGELTATRIQNFKRMKERRKVFNLGVTYETPRDKVKAIPQMIKDILARESGVRIDRVHFASYGDSALIFEVVYYALTANYNEYMDTQQRINEGIMDAFAEEKIEFAYPTQTIYTKKGE